MPPEATQSNLAAREPGEGAPGLCASRGPRTISMAHQVRDRYVGPRRATSFSHAAQKMGRHGSSSSMFDARRQHLSAARSRKGAAAAQVRCCCRASGTQCARQTSRSRTGAVAALGRSARARALAPVQPDVRLAAVCLHERSAPGLEQLPSARAPHSVRPNGFAEGGAR